MLVMFNSVPAVVIAAALTNLVVVKCNLSLRIFVIGRIEEDVVVMGVGEGTVTVMGSIDRVVIVEMGAVVGRIVEVVVVGISPVVVVEVVVIVLCIAVEAIVVVAIIDVDVKGVRAFVVV